ncbi:hypothetical protein CK203_052365 [Vitis vinifera]|uniref:Uncharacterized protein n=1 Tax=Vitis vinifera TaxID=29760 RepID=A0A438H2X7_VITVI|nr:hypothetical protein CK203_052365 [Vitis vinifera]
MNGLQSRHAEPESTSIDSMPSSPPTIRMLVAHTLLTTSQDQTTIVPPIITPGHHTDYCASLCHSIRDLIDSGVASFPVSPTDIDSGLVHFSHVVPSPSGSCHHVSGT